MGLAMMFSMKRVSNNALALSDSVCTTAFIGPLALCKAGEVDAAYAGMVSRAERVSATKLILVFIGMIRLPRLSCINSKEAGQECMDINVRKCVSSNSIKLHY